MKTARYTIAATEPTIAIAPTLLRSRISPIGGILHDDPAGSELLGQRISAPRMITTIRITRRTRSKVWPLRRITSASAPQVTAVKTRTDDSIGLIQDAWD